MNIFKHKTTQPEKHRLSVDQVFEELNHDPDIRLSLDEEYIKRISQELQQAVEKALMISSEYEKEHLNINESIRQNLEGIWKALRANDSEKFARHKLVLEDLLAKVRSYIA